MRFNRQLFKEAYKAGYKKAKQLLRERRNVATPKNGQQYRTLFQKLYTYAKGDNLSYKVFIKDMGIINKLNNKYFQQAKDDVVVGYCTINDFDENADGIKIYDENHELLADVQYFEVEDAKLVPYPDTRGNVLQITTETNDIDRITPNHEDRKQYFQLQFLPISQSGKERPFGQTIRSLAFDKSKDRSDGAADYYEEDFDGSRYISNDYKIYKNAREDLNNRKYTKV